MSHSSETASNAEERYRLLLDAITDYAIYMLDPDGVVVSWNAGAARFKGYIESEIIGQHFSQFYLREDRDWGRPGKALETAVREGRSEGEGWRVRKDGTQFWAHVVIDPIRSEDGIPIGFAEITQDLTERKTALPVTDHAMPHMTGSQLADTIRMQWPDTPVLLATGYAELPPGANPDLPRLGKPFSERQLDEAVRSVMGN